MGQQRKDAANPYKTGFIEVSDGHQLYYELSGNPEGPAALVLHGGPGAGSSPHSRQFFDPEHYRIVLLDQRGSGNSIPNVSEDYDAAMLGNNTWKLIEDIEVLRGQLQLDTWPLILGGSWGSTLAIAYAQLHPDRVQSLVLRGVFTFLPDEIDGLFQTGRVADHYPEAWKDFVTHIRSTSQNWAGEQHNLLGAYQARLRNPDTRIPAASAFVNYELSISQLRHNQQRIDEFLAAPAKLVPFAAIEVNYMLAHGYFSRGQLYDNVVSMVGHKVRIVHGRNDAVCLPNNAVRFADALENAGVDVEVEIVEAAGHSDNEIPIAKSLRAITDFLRLSM